MAKPTTGPFVEPVVADQQSLDLRVGHAAYFDAQNTEFETVALASYHQVIGGIKAKCNGTPVGASESIFRGLSEATGLDLITPYSFLKAISEGTDPSAADTDQIDSKQIEVFVYNSQNATPDIQRLVDAASQCGIPVTRITETLTPSRAGFQAWPCAQLHQLESALARATGH